VARFLTHLVVTPLPVERAWWHIFAHRRRWLILSPLIFESTALDRLIVIPTGFHTDFASVPRLPLLFTLAGDSAHKAAVIHDFGYSLQGDIGGGPPISRRAMDDVFAEAIRAPGPEHLRDDWPGGDDWTEADLKPDWKPEEPPWREWLLWGGVRLGGWWAWAT
jgi:hypothetical protein